MEPSTNLAIALDDVTKTYTRRVKTGLVRRTRTDVEAVAGITLRVERGEMLAYVGPNGAGKSTTIKMITGVLHPSSGRLNVLGFNPPKQRTQLARHLGVVFGQRSQLWWDLPLGESFSLLRHLYRVEQTRFDHNRNEMVDRLDLGNLLTTPVRQLSLGQRMRGELTAAFLHDPDLVVLDEPTIGLDIVSKYAVREFLTEINRDRGTTVLLTTHDLDDVEQLCERMVIIDDGRVVIDGDIASFKQRYGTTRTLVVDLTQAVAPLTIANATSVTADGPRQTITFDRRTTTAAEVLAEVTAGHEIHDLSIAEPDIEAMLRQLPTNSSPDGL